MSCLNKAPEEVGISAPSGEKNEKRASGRKSHFLNHQPHRSERAREKSKRATTQAPASARSVLEYRPAEARAVQGLPAAPANPPEIRNVIGKTAYGPARCSDSAL